MSFEDWKELFVGGGFEGTQASHYARVFMWNDVQLDMIMELTNDILLQMGIRKAGHRIRILRLQKNKKIVGNKVPQDATNWVPSDNNNAKPKTNKLSTSKKVPLPQEPANEEGEAGPPTPELPSPPPASSAPAKANPMSQSNPSFPAQIHRSPSQTSLNPPPAGPTQTPGPPVANPIPGSVPSTPLPLGASPTVARLAAFSPLAKPPPQAFHTPAKAAPITLESLSDYEGNLRTGIAYFLNDDLTKHRLPTSNITVGEFREEVMKKHKNKLTQEWAVFSTSQEDQKLVILKEDQILTPGTVYYIIFNSNVQYMTKKLQKKLKKEHDVTMQRTPDGRPVYTSDNHPIKVDYVPDDELYMSAVGRIGLCMAPGRTKKKQQHDWARDLAKDLDRIKHHYGCNVFVTLVRHAELRAIHTPNLFEEVEARGMDSIHFPIKDKYIPNSMEHFLILIETIIDQLKQGKTVVVHCNGGKGRSGTVLVATLVALGRTVQQAIDIVRKARPGTIQNPLQIAYVKRFKTAWRKSKHKQLKEQEKRIEPKRDKAHNVSSNPMPQSAMEEDIEDEKLDEAEKIAWNQHEKKIQEDDDGEDENIVINPGKHTATASGSATVTVSAQTNAASSTPSETRNQSPLRNMKKEPPTSSGIMSRIGIKVKQPEKSATDKMQQKIEKKKIKEVNKIQAAYEKQSKKLEKNKKLLRERQANLEVNEQEGDESNEGIEMLEPNVDEVSEEEVEVLRKEARAEGGKARNSDSKKAPPGALPAPASEEASAPSPEPIPEPPAEDAT